MPLSGLLLSLGEDGLGVEVGFENAPGGNIHGRYRRQQLPQLGGPPLAGERPGAPGLLRQRQQPGDVANSACHFCKERQPSPIPVTCGRQVDGAAVHLVNHDGGMRLALFRRRSRPAGQLVVGRFGDGGRGRHGFGVDHPGQLLQHAVITAHSDGGGRAAYAVDLRHEGVRCEEPAWIARGLQEIPSGTVHFDEVPATPVGGPGWYHSRPGFAWGGMGVAACWLGGAVGLARDYRASLLAAADAGRQPDQLALAALGETDRILASALQYLAGTAARIDDGSLGRAGQGTWSEAQRVRGTVAAAVERILHLVGTNRGPAPLAFDETYAKRMADLGLYVRQHHGRRDDAQLGSLTLSGDCPW